MLPPPTRTWAPASAAAPTPRRPATAPAPRGVLLEHQLATARSAASRHRCSTASGSPIRCPIPAELHLQLHRPERLLDPGELQLPEPHQRAGHHDLDGPDRRRPGAARRVAATAARRAGRSCARCPSTRCDHGRRPSPSPPTCWPSPGSWPRDRRPAQGHVWRADAAEHRRAFWLTWLVVAVGIGVAGTVHLGPGSPGTAWLGAWVALGCGQPSLLADLVDTRRHLRRCRAAALRARAHRRPAARADLLACAARPHHRRGLLGARPAGRAAHRLRQAARPRSGRASDSTGPPGGTA